MGDPIDTGAVRESFPYQRVHDLCAEVDRLRAENAALRELVGRFYTQAWEDPLTPEQSHLLVSIVETDRG